jgi:hypothetical protein
MTKEYRPEKHALIGKVFAALLGSPWLEVLAEGWKLGRKLWRGLADEGMYKVLEHEATLELLDTKGKRALVHKRQKVQYLHNNIIAYQDQAWGDGEFLVNYQCSPGVEADRYRVGHKTYVLISLREVKEKGEKDEFNILWEFRGSFMRDVEVWGTEVSHRTKQLKLQVIFPKQRFPYQVSLVEQLRQRTNRLEQEAIRQLPDGRYSTTWEIDKPRLHEQYIFKWKW